MPPLSGRPPPPLYVVMMEISGRTLDRTASLPKSARFTFGQRLDNVTLDALELVIRAFFEPRGRRKADHLRELNLALEVLRALWRLVEQRGWIAQRQLLHIVGRPPGRGRADVRRVAAHVGSR